MLIIIGCLIVILVFFWYGCVSDCRKEAEKKAREEEFEAHMKARREKIAASPNVANIAQAIVSHYGFPEKIEIFRWGIIVFNQGTPADIRYESLGIADILGEDRGTLASALCRNSLLEDKYKMGSNGDGDVWLELKMPASSKTLQEW